MDHRDMSSHMDFRSQFSTRRYTYEGYGGQKHDKTLILHKSETCNNDTILLRLCKRSWGRATSSSCAKGKLTLATFMALMAIFCYFNIFSTYLPKPCRVFSVRSSSHALKSVANETVFVRTRNALSEQRNGLDMGPRKASKGVSVFTKKVAAGMQTKTALLKAVPHPLVNSPKPSTASWERYFVTSSPDGKTPDDSTSANGMFGAKPVDRFAVKTYGTKIAEYDLVEKPTLIYRLIKSGKSVNAN